MRLSAAAATCAGGPAAIFDALDAWFGQADYQGCLFINSLLETRDPDVRLGVHLGMSGRVLVDDEEAGDPLIYASNLRMPKWHRFGVHFAEMPLTPARIVEALHAAGAYGKLDVA